MIRQLTARALQMSTMEREQIEKLHDLENRRGYMIPNWNIQELFNLHTIKENYGVNEDDLGAQASYQMRIEDEIEKSGIKNMAERNEIGLDWYHSFDWAVHRTKDSIDWYHTTKGKGLLKRLADSAPFVFLLALK